MAACPPLAGVSAAADGGGETLRLKDSRAKVTPARGWCRKPLRWQTKTPTTGVNRKYYLYVQTSASH
jgi:hypothetical protein